jgi:inosine-uridine nucleoside N-ribohydrolase
MEPKRIILDCDPGIDDGIAILLAMNSPELQILGITTVAGNAPVSMTTINACRVLQLGKSSEIKVYKGESEPLRKRNQVFPTYCGSDGLCESYLPLVNKFQSSESAVDFIIRKLREDYGITLVLTAPMTNIATAIQIAPEIKTHINAIITSGGYFGVHEPLVDFKPHAEWNVEADPEAAKIIFESGISIYAMGADVTMHLNDKMVDLVLSAASDPVTRKFLDHASNYNLKHHIKRSSLLVDEMAVAYAVDSTLAKLIIGSTKIELKEKIDDNFSLLIKSDGSKSHSYIHAAYEFDFDRYIDLLLDRVFGNKTG